MCCWSAQALVLPSIQQRRASTLPADRRRPRTCRPRAADDRSRGAQQAVRHAPGGLSRAGRPRVFRGPAVLRAEHRRRPRPARRSCGRHRGQPAQGARGRNRHKRLCQGGPIHPVLRCVRHPDRFLRGRARLPAGARPGARRDHPARSQAALRVRGGDGAQADGHHPQGLRRGLLRDVAQADGG